MGRGIRHVRRTVLRELRTEHRHDLFAQDVELLEHRLQRQASVIHQEHLTLIVTEVVAHGSVAVDDFLRATDGQRGLLGELLQTRAVAVYRRIIEVRAELIDGILRVLAHEDLTAEADDRLVGGAVTVVLEALAIVPDQLHVVLLRPEDIVREESVAVVRGLFGDFWAADAAVPDEGRHAVEWARR